MGITSAGILVILILMFVLVQRRRGGEARFSRPRPRPRWVRITCGVLAAGLAITVIVGSIKDSADGYHDVSATVRGAPLGSVTVPFQTYSWNEFTLSPLPPGGSGHIDYAKAPRFFMYVVGYDIPSTSHNVLNVVPRLESSREPFAFWKDVRLHESFEWPIKGNHFRMVLKGKITSVSPWGEYRVTGDFSVDYSFDDGNASSEASSRWTQASLKGGAMTDVPIGGFGMKSAIRPIKETAPLEQISLHEWLRRSDSESEFATSGSVVESFVKFGGPALVILLIAVLLAAQCFASRAKGLLVSWLCATLLVVALDRTVLAIHASHLAPDRPAAVRSYARSQLDATFFFKKTAEQLTKP